MKLKKMLALLLALVMTMSLVTLPSYAEEIDSALTITANGEMANKVGVPQGGKVKLEVQPIGDGDCRWQINVDGDMWVDIYGENSTTCMLTYAKVRNILDMNGSTQVRCAAEINGEEVVSKAVSVYATAAEAQSAAARKTAAKAAAPAKAPLLSDPPTLEEEYTVTINYMFSSNGQPAAEPWAATVTKGANLTQTIDNPKVVGYEATASELPDGVSFTTESVELNLQDIGSDMTITVAYQPAIVDYTVKYYQQNVADDNYTLTETKTYQALTDSKLDTSAINREYAGFYQLPYDEAVTIAADGSTEIEIYYDRDYYLMTFDLDGGYGVEPIYARYGTPISVGIPTKIDYTFIGWDQDVPATMPAENTGYTATWQVDGPVKVTVVIWGENADDENYSYCDSLTLTAMPDEKLSYADVQGKTVCGKDEHNHTAACGMNCTHTQHDLTCYGIAKNALPVTPSSEARTQFEKLGLTDKRIYYFNDRGIGSSDHYYLYLNGQYYEYTGKPTSYIGKQEGSNSYDPGLGSLTDYFYKYDAKLSCTHTHTDACYTCGKEAHTHTADCYLNTNVMDPSLWTLVKSDTVTVAADGSTVLNVYYDRKTFALTFKDGRNTVKTITEKFGADIHGNFPIKDGNKTVWWIVPSGCQSFKSGTYLGSIDTMPSENITFTSAGAESGATLHYYVEALSGAAGQHSYSGKNFNLYKQINLSKGGSLTYTEEFHDIIGFTQWKSDPKFDKMEQGGKTSGINTNNYLYYTRNSYDLKFYNYNDYVTGKGGSVQYEAPLKSYDFSPAYPSTLEPGAYEFKGWYTTAACYAGSEADLNAMTMPATDVVLYAKWAPVKHTVSFYLDDNTLASGDKLYADKTVEHGAKTDVPATPEKGSYNFVGWFYKDGDTEKAFDFANMPVTRDMQVYGKWSSTVLKQYFIYYKVQGTDTEIADPTTGSALAGNTKTFTAKGGGDLYASYREGYFPVTTSHSLTLDIENDDNNIFVFEYVQKAAVPYTVKYLKAGTNEELKPAKHVEDNRKAVVTEKFEVIPGYMPDAYQKSMVVSGADDAENTIIFYYTEDTQHAYYKATHYLQNLDGTTYAEYKTKQAKGNIGETYSEDELTIPGYTYNSEKSKASGVLTAEGLELNLYYDRNSYPYQVNYLEQGTNKVLADPTKGTDVYGKLISASAKTISGYTLVSAATQTCTIAIENGETAAKNVINFYYTEDQVTINYKVVGPKGCGTVTPADETVKVISGAAKGSTAAVSNDNYKFVGWYSDADCTIPVPADQVVNNKFTPVKNADGQYVAATYYAKFDWNVADLTVTKIGCDTDKDTDQSFIFHVTGNGVDMYVTVQGNGSATIKGLKVGDYTVEEVSDWSWRYQPDSVSKDVEVKGGQNNTVTFNNERTKNQWLSGDSYAVNSDGMKACGTFVSGN